ncbi:UPF0182 family protein [Corynebacterium marinum]|uniref:UPF0182 protein B840_02910 n=1 Tax=Corynebacterium marinum DSM 44953 TaxID=1224162 RepID=A0A0B6TRJ9_9CORY|nr:UPF0182 family protein [Corynebacterium marinum]AJK68210.1 hypothetical protein B840_02910 [Corynebacterium marinum DSM 44953]GGO10196.1 UPF0182 protein Cgl0786/cg0896 [Corynebacterium marinum]
MATGLSQPSPSINRPPRVLSWIIGIIAALFILAPLAVGFYTDWLWFGEVDFRGVFTKVLLVRIALFFVFALVAGFVVWLAGFFTWRNRPDSLENVDLNSPVHQYRQALDKSVRGLLIGIPVIVGVFAGFIGQGTWRTVMMFLNAEPFGQTDAQFGHDLGFYAFTLPLLRLLVDTFSMLLVVAFIIGLVGHYLLGSIRIGNQAMGIKGHISRGARVQLAITGGLWMLLQVASYFLDRYTLLYASQETFTGASYTDINAVLPAKIILMIIAAFVAVAFFSAIVLKDLRIPALGVVLLLLSSFVIGVAWPLLMERFSVQPNRVAKESEYIARNIEATRHSYGLTDDQVTYLDNWGSAGASDDDVAADEATISNIRLLDPEILAPTFTQMQQLRNFYGFPETLNVDRYQVDGELRDFVVAARELDPNALRENQRDWINRHTVYTHGNGFIAAQANTVDEAAQDAGSTRGGFPVFTVSDLQSNAAREASEEAEELGIKVDQPRIYYGPVIASSTDGADYAIVGDNGSDPVEYDTDNSFFTYDGSGGVDVGNMINRAAFALRYQEMNLVLSDRVHGDSKIIFERDPRARVEKVAPWLTTDSKTYPAVIDGRIKWIVDGYTTLSALPYSEQTSLTETTVDALNPDGTNQRLITDEVGYIRNSVKATVDAYDGTVELYEFDTEDPVLKVWQGIFPDTVNPESEISEELRQHMRYPEDMFKVQRELLARYHVSDPGVFFTNDAFWSVPGDPTAPEGRQELNQPPYYVVASDPETQESSFQLITPYRGLNREFLSAHMTVSSDPETYGKMTVRVLPTNTQTQGPKQAQDAMMSSDQVARDRTLWEGSNDLHNGNLLTLPVGGGEILYVEPIYSQRKNQESAFPKLLRVLVSYKGRVGYAPTISESLAQVGIDPRAAQDIAGTPTAPTTPAEPETGEEGQTPEEDTPTPPATAAGTEGEAIERINEALSNLETAQNGSFEEYGKALDELDRAVEEYQSLTAGN